jgi:uncharacterized protein
MTPEPPTFGPAAQKFWAGVERDELLLPWCVSCGKPHFPPRPFCPFCWSDEIEWRKIAGTGTLYTHTIVHANPPSHFVSELPYAIGIVRLDEGVQMMCHMQGDLGLLACDAPVEVGFSTLNGKRVPSFSVVARSG